MFFVIKKKNKNGTGTHAELRVNLGYAERVITFDKAIISEILGITLKELGEAEEGKKWQIK